MITFLGFSMIIIFTYLIMTKKLSPLVALIVIPVIFGTIAGFYNDLGTMIMDGIKVVAPTAVLLFFAILFFSIMLDAGLFDPLINKIIAIVDGSPVKIAVGTAVISMLIALDGDGTTTHMITIAAMFPIYKRLGMNRLVLATISLLSVSVMSAMTPWGGPATRAIAALGLDANEFFLPIIPTLVLGMVSIILVAFVLGKMEEKRLLFTSKEYSAIFNAIPEMALSLEDTSYLKRPKLIIPNFILTITVMGLLVFGVLPAATLFMIGFVIALMINYPDLELQKERIEAHSSNVITVVALVFAAGAFTGIFSGTGMVDAIATSIVNLIPDSVGPAFPIVVAITSLPLTFVLSNDAYYYGVLPILAEAASAFGIDPLEIARASVLGQPIHFLSPLVASTLLLIGMVKVELGQFQKYAFIPALTVSIILIIVAILTGAITLF